MSKPDLSFWLTVDEFTLRDAAYLWTNEEPENVSSHNLPPRQAVAAQLISKQAGASLPAYFMPDPTSNHWVASDRRAASTGTTVTRAELLTVAKKVGWMPLFLSPSADDKPLIGKRELIASILDRIEQHARAEGFDFDRRAMPGRKMDFQEMCIEIDRDQFYVAEATFNDYLKGICRFKQGAKQTDFYRELLS